MMEIYVPGSGTRSKLDFCRKNEIGFLFSPHRLELPKADDKLYFVDNGAYRAYLNKEIINTNSFYAFLGKIQKCTYPPKFVCIPDIVAGGARSFEFSLMHLAKIPEGLRKYWVVQDGQYPALIEETALPLVDGLFVGGSTIWKWRTAENWITLAHEYKKKCHIGRVGTWRNFLRAYNLGADSVDGSTLMRHNCLHKIIDWRQEIKSVRKLVEKEGLMMNIGAAVYADSTWALDQLHEE
ncbi:MAG TPA: hypothetical protein PLN56_12050 [Methanoregulaceae archaeon]|mgnify:FL=1|nr:hypothetical protein [Methanoregulaceae archaeon]